MSIRQYYIPLESREEWEQALSGIEHTFGHTWENCHAMHLTTGLKTSLYCFEKDDVRIVSPIAEREFNGYVDIVKPFGFSGFVDNGNCPEFAPHWRNFVREREYVCGYLGLNPIFDCSGYFESKEIYEYDSVCVLDLRPSIDELRAGMSSGRRKQLRHWDQISQDLVFEKSSLTDFFLANYHDFMNAKSASAEYYFSKESLSFLLSLEKVILVGARSAGKVVALVVFPYTADSGDGLFSISVPEGRQYSAALVWYAILSLKKLEIPIVNLGTARGSVGDFKRHFGCRELPLKCVKQIYRPDIYETLCRQANADPNDRSGYFPAYRKQGPAIQDQMTG